MLIQSLNNRKKKIRVGISVSALNVNYIIIEEKGKQLTMLTKGELSANDIPSALNIIKKEALNFPCFLALPYREFIIKTLIFSDIIKEKEISQLLDLNANHYFSYPIDKLNYDFEYLNKEKTKLRILASKKEVIASWQQKFEKANLKLTTVTADLIALERLFISLQVLIPEKVYAIFLRQNKELLEVILINSMVWFKRVIVISEPNAPIIQQEITKFIRLYESSRCFVNLVDEIILLIPGLCQQTIFLSLPIYDFFANHKQISAEVLLAWGLVSSC